MYDWSTVTVLFGSPWSKRSLPAAYQHPASMCTQGNLAENPKAYIIAIDYLRRERVKIWGRARVIEDDAALVARLLRGRQNSGANFHTTRRCICL